MLEPVKLSLATFQPNKCYAPYLNTPRSLEACRLNGVNPVELVEIPFNEFQKDFPNNTDAVQRRYERINGARLRLYDQVMRDWKRLCENNWKPPSTRPQSAKETIIVVSPQAHCKLLEMQAEKFRKIEEHNWQSLQRSLKLEIMRADMDVRHKAIIEKHEGIEQANNELAEQRKMERDELYRQQLLRQQQEEIEELKAIKREQEAFQAQIIRQAQDEAENKRREKFYREQKESERVRSAQYTQAVRESILSNMESKAENRKKTSEVRAQSEEQRIKEYFEMKEKEREARKAEIENKIKKANLEKQRQAEEEREQVITNDEKLETIILNISRVQTLAKIRESEKHRQEVAAQREKSSKHAVVANDQEIKEKVQKIRDTKENLTKEKSERTWQQLKHKEDIARQELEKIKDAQEQRRTIKAIRQEAYEIALFRAQKAEEYRREKLLRQLKEKEERANAIKQGFETLSQMRTSMKDIMIKTNLGMRAELNDLRHKDIFSPDRVISKALEVSNRVLFPSLEKKFGIKDPNEEDPVSKLFRTTGDEGFTFNVGGSNNAFMTTNDDDMDKDNAPLYEGDRTGTMKSATQDKGPKAKSKKHEMAPLPIHQLTQNNLKNALLESMKKVEELNNADHFGGTSKSPTRSRSPHASSRRDTASRHASRGAGERKGEKGHGHDEDDENNFPTPILKLPQDDAFSDSKAGRRGSVRSAPNSLTSSHSASKNSLSRSDGFQLGKHTHPAPDNHLMDKSRGHKKEKEAPHRDDDPKLPMYPFTAGAEFNDQGQSSKAEEENRPQTGSQKKAQSSSQKLSSKSHKQLCTDVNADAKFLDPPPGKFRREFSNDHPLAAGGKGKYKKELQQGLKPTGLDVKVPHSQATDVAETLNLAKKVEKLTYEATTRVVDPSRSLDALEKELKEQLQELIEEERLAEEDRFQTLSQLKDEAEKKNLEQIFAEERQRASERIMKATREHDEMLKKAMLRSMNLGSV